MSLIHNGVTCIGAGCMQCAHDAVCMEIFDVNRFSRDYPLSVQLRKEQVYAPILHRFCDAAPGVFTRAWIDGPVPWDGSVPVVQMHFRMACTSLKSGFVRTNEQALLFDILRVVRDRAPGTEHLSLQLDVLREAGLLFTMVQTYVAAQRLHRVHGDGIALRIGLLFGSLWMCACTTGDPLPCRYSAAQVAKKVVFGGAEIPFLKAVAAVATDLAGRTRSANAADRAALAELAAEVTARSPYFRNIAVLMGLHTALGRRSPLMLLDAEVMRMIVEPAPPRIIVWEDVYADLLS